MSKTARCAVHHTNYILLVESEIPFKGKILISNLERCSQSILYFKIGVIMKKLLMLLILSSVVFNYASAYGRKKSATEKCDPINELGQYAFIISENKDGDVTVFSSVDEGARDIQTDKSIRVKKPLVTFKKDELNRAAVNCRYWRAGGSAIGVLGGAVGIAFGGLGAFFTGGATLPVFYTSFPLIGISGTRTYQNIERAGVLSCFNELKEEISTSSKSEMIILADTESDFLHIVDELEDEQDDLNRRRKDTGLGAISRFMNCQG